MSYQTDWDKVEATIYSCKTLGQWEVARRMLRNFKACHGVQNLMLELDVHFLAQKNIVMNSGELK